MNITEEQRLDFLERTNAAISAMTQEEIEEYRAEIAFYEGALADGLDMEYPND